MVSRRSHHSNSRRISIDADLLSDPNATITSITPTTSIVVMDPAITPLQLPVPVPVQATPPPLVPGGSFRLSQAHSTSVGSKVRPHRHDNTSASVPPSSRANNNYSDYLQAANSSQDPSEVIDARAANYEMLLRQFRLRQSVSRLSIPTSVPSVANTPAVSSAAPISGRSGRSGRIQRAGSADDLLNSLSRLAANLPLDRIRKRSIESSAHAMSDPVTVDGSSPSKPARRLSLTRTIRHTKKRVCRWFEARVYDLMEPMSPQSSTRVLRYWLLYAVLAFQLLYWPFAPSLMAAGTPSSTTRSTMINLNVFLELFLLLELAMQLNTAILIVTVSSRDPSRTYKTLVTSRKALLQRAIRSSSTYLDLLGALPLEYGTWLRYHDDTLPLILRNPSLYYFGHVLRLLQLRHLRFPGKESTFCRRTHFICTFIKLIALVLVVLHYLACGWHLVLHDLDVPEGDELHIWTHYVHVLVQVALLLLGDGLAVTQTLLNSTNHLTAQLYVLGGLVLGVFLIATVLARLVVEFLQDLIHSEYFLLQYQLTQVASQMDKLEVPTELQDRIKGYFKHMHTAYGALTSNPLAFTRNLTTPLALEVGLCRYMTLLTRQALWKHCSADLLSYVILHVENRVYLRDDVVIRRGEVVAELSLVYRGVCEVIVAPRIDPHAGAVPLTATAFTKKIPTGGAVGQLSLLMDHRRMENVRALTHLELCVVTRQVFQDILSRFVEDRERLVRRILRNGLETNENPMLWQHVAFHNTKASRRSKSSDDLNGEQHISARDGARILSRALGLHKLSWGQTLQLPISFDTDDPSAKSILRPRHRRPTMKPGGSENGSSESYSVVGSRETSDAPVVTAPTQPGGELLSMLLNETAATQHTLASLSSSHEHLLRVLHSVAETVVRMDTKLTRLDERVHRLEDDNGVSHRVNGHLMRRRSSRRESSESGAVLQRRRSANSDDQGTQRWLDVTGRSQRLTEPDAISRRSSGAGETSDMSTIEALGPLLHTNVALLDVHQEDEDRGALSSPPSTRPNTLGAAIRAALRARSFSDTNNKDLINYQRRQTTANGPVRPQEAETSSPPSSSSGLTTLARVRGAEDEPATRRRSLSTFAEHLWSGSGRSVVIGGK
ncbi:hypothetical protein Poli38472_006926 [Pythium oligandrum]|uniref:Cyclic nucleotide-binding domain-containing protein n=1 Tax=Pythium oligandrum TaxID=41045 RepID=A0A8K1C9C0_PYTOL|nr:hypothetical protein Poli38472_006926 [Pythium oligandrum]|eukprot:TMW58781.1 hypothetical protein Poli38472_006926 [Pythium oligandrum]